MGDRGNVKIVYEDGKSVYLYTHWYGTDLPSIVAKALDRHVRWEDPSYLTRIIFSEMLDTADALHEETGFGIAPYQVDIGRMVVVDMRKKTVKVDDDIAQSFESFITRWLEK